MAHSPTGLINTLSPFLQPTRREEGVSRCDAQEVFNTFVTQSQMKSHLLVIKLDFLSQYELKICKSTSGQLAKLKKIY